MALSKKNTSSKKVETYKYPEDLSSNRYVELAFFIPKTENNIESLIGSLTQAGIAPYNSVDGRDKTNGSVSTALNNLETKIKSTISAVAKTLTEEKREAFNAKELKSILHLPLPNNLNDSSNNSFSESSGIISNLVGTLNTTLDKVNEVSNNLGARNIIANADLNLMYKGSGLRKASLTWTFTPRSKKETIAITKIIKIIKMYSSPDASISRHFLKAPAFVELTLSNKILNDIQRYRYMVINSVSIDFGSGGNMEMFYDGMIKEITVSISLSELKVNTMQDWTEDFDSVNKEIK